MTLKEKTLSINADGKVNNNAEAIAAKLSAKKIRLNVKESSASSGHFSQMDLEIADRLETSANSYLTLPQIPERIVGGELISSDSSDVPTTHKSVRRLDRVTLDASLDRVELIHKNGVLNLALDAAEALEVQNPIEQMLVHQMAAVHRMSLDLMAQAGNTRDIVEKCRLVNASSRLMDIYQKGMLTINKVRTGGQQIVTVQHVQVSNGGQAVVTGTILNGRDGIKK